MKKILCFILLMVLSCFCGCGKQEVPISQEVLQDDSSYIYNRFLFLIDQSVSDCATAFWKDGLMEEDPSGKIWTFKFDDELDVDIRIQVEELEDYWSRAKYTIYENGEEVDSFEAHLSYNPPDLQALYVDITDDRSEDLVIIGSALGRGQPPTPWVYAYDFKNRERISIFDSEDIDNIEEGDIDGCLTEKQTEQMKAIVEGDKRFKEVFPDGEIYYSSRVFMCGVPMVDAGGNVYFEVPIWGKDFTGYVDGCILLFLTYNADTKEFDVSDILY